MNEHMLSCPLKSSPNSLLENERCMSCCAFLDPFYSNYTAQDTLVPLFCACGFQVTGVRRLASLHLAAKHERLFCSRARFVYS